MKQRIELNTHSTYDTMNSVLTLEDMIEFAYDSEMSALALTDLNCVQGFPKFLEYCDRAVIKPIFGAQIIHCDFSGGYPFISTVLVKNQTGLKNLYKIISALKNDGVCKNVPTEVLEENHEGLLYGSAGHDGGLFQSLIDENFEGYKSFLKFYDYYEIENFYNTPKEKEANKIIAAMAKGLKKPVVAISGARYIDKNDAVCLAILDGCNKRKENTNNLHFRSTEEMLQEFSYLGEDTEEVVINNTHKIADMIEKVEVLPDSVFENADDRAYKQLKVMAVGFCGYKYGDLDPLDIPKKIQERLDAELELPIVKDCADKLLLAREFVREVKMHNRNCCTRGALASSFLAYCLEITDINPLPPHYYCPNCKKVEWVSDASCGYDLPDKKCSCGSIMQGDGMNIPYESFYGFTGDKVPDIAINVDSQMYDIVPQRINDECNVNLCFASTVSTIGETHALHLISEYEKKSGKNFIDDEKKAIIGKLEHVKKEDGIHPADLLIFPKNISDFIPITEDKYHGLPISHFCAWDLWDYIFKIDIVSCGFIDFLQKLESETGVNISTAPVNTNALFELIHNKDLTGITEFGTEYVVEMIKISNPQTFSDLAKISGLSHSTNAWNGNAENLIKNGICTLKEIPAFRDDIYYDLINHGLERGKAFRYAETVRKGLFAKKHLSKENVKEFESDLMNIGMPDWYAAYCEKILYMFPKAHAYEYTRIAAIESWYKAHFREEFNASFRTYSKQ